MYSEQLEQLIKSVIADGVITEKERAVLHKKAASEGVDEDEIDVYIDGLVAQMKPTVKQEQKFDLKYLNKSKKDTYTVYEGKNLYRVNGFAVGRIQELYLNFFKKIEKDDEQLGISVIIVYKEGMTAFGLRIQDFLLTHQHVNWIWKMAKNGLMFLQKSCQAKDMQTSIVLN